MISRVHRILWLMPNLRTRTDTIEKSGQENTSPPRKRPLAPASTPLIEFEGKNSKGNSWRFWEDKYNLHNATKTKASPELEGSLAYNWKFWKTHYKKNHTTWKELAKDKYEAKHNGTSWKKMHFAIKKANRTFYNLPNSSEAVVADVKGKN